MPPLAVCLQKWLHQFIDLMQAWKSWEFSPHSPHYQEHSDLNWQFSTNQFSFFVFLFLFCHSCMPNNSPNMLVRTLDKRSPSKYMHRIWKIKLYVCPTSQELTKYLSFGVVMVAHDIQFEDFHHFRGRKRFNHLSCFVTKMHIVWLFLTQREH